jgi:hypothetical protein
MVTAWMLPFVALPKLAVGGIRCVKQLTHTLDPIGLFALQNRVFVLAITTPRPVWGYL